MDTTKGLQATLNFALLPVRLGIGVTQTVAKRVLGHSGQENGTERVETYAPPVAGPPPVTETPPVAEPPPVAAKPLDDATIAHKVESIIFRDPEVPKGQINVNVASGVVWLRGEAKTPEMIKSLEAETREIPEVIEVENLLHLPNTPAPTRTDTPAPMRKTRQSSERVPH